MRAKSANSEGGSSGPVAVYVSDPSVEAERIAQLLQACGFAVVDVPLGLLVGRVAVQRPRVILMDSDQHGAWEVAHQIRHMPEASLVSMIFVGRERPAEGDSAHLLGEAGVEFFPRPVNVSALLARVEALSGGSDGGGSFVSMTPPPPAPSQVPAPPSAPAAISERVPRDKRSSVPPDMAVQPRLSFRPLPVESGAAVSGAPPRSIGMPLSPDLQSLLAEAEEKAGTWSHPPTEGLGPTAEDEVESVVPAALLDSLDVPLMEEGEDTFGDDGQYPGRRSARVYEAMFGRESSMAPQGQRRSDVPKTQDGTGSAVTTGAFQTKEIFGTEKRKPGSMAPSPRLGSTGENPTIRYAVPLPRRTSEPPSSPPVSSSSDTHVARPSSSKPPPQERVVPSVLGAGDAFRVLAKTVTSQQSGVFCFAESGVERRVVLRDGALVTAASSADEESLLSFLVMRGDLPKDKAQRLSQKVPGFGRHAAAALVARGYLAQENLPGVLRAHAEWILAHVAAMKDGILTVERSPSGRLLAEAAVFDPREGHEVLVDLARRSVSTAEALSRMGGAGGRLGEGNLWHVLGHCGLGPQVQSAVQQVAQGMSLKEAKLVSDTDDFLTIVYALTELGVLQIAKAIFEDGETTTSKVELQDPLEEAAVRTRILGKKQVVDEGDYFAVLGVDPFATPYEIRRAFLEMRRSFDPSRILTPNLASLAEDVRHIISVAEEAYEILRDDARRERYRRAIGLEEKSSE